MTEAILLTLLGLSLWLNGALLTLRLRAEQRAARIPEGWEETESNEGLSWYRGGAVIGYDPICDHTWINSGAVPLDVMIAFRARAKEWRR